MTGHRGDNVAAGVVPVVVGPLLQPPPPEGGCLKPEPGVGERRQAGHGDGRRRRNIQGRGRAAGRKAPPPPNRWIGGGRHPQGRVWPSPPPREKGGPPVVAWDTWRGDAWVGVTQPVTQGPVAVVMRGRTGTEERTEGRCGGGGSRPAPQRSELEGSWCNGPRETVPSIGAFAEGIPTRIAGPIPSDSVRGL